MEAAKRLEAQPRRTPRRIGRGTWRAWVAVRRNNGGPGIDKITLAGVEEYGIIRLLDPR
jgi:hypothetical protein